jgi:signal transduction histidine kinase
VEAREQADEAALSQLPRSPNQLRLWLSRELHDQVVSRLATILVEMELARRRPDGEAGRRELENYQDSIRETLASLRRVLCQLRGDPWQTEGFGARLQRLLRHFQERTGIKAQIEQDPAWPLRLSARSAHELLGIVEQALHNVRSHSGASRVKVRLQCMKSQASLVITDDGIGYNESSPTAQGGIGLPGMSERAVLMGGDLLVHGVPGVGTTVRATFPLARLS